jgi:membrane-anchored glycerophosphoryl diester phosphodiesterase (GDPDase)
MDGVLLAQSNTQTFRNTRGLPDEGNALSSFYVSSRMAWRISNAKQRRVFWRKIIYLFEAFILLSLLFTKIRSYFSCLCLCPRSKALLGKVRFFHLVNKCLFFMETRGSLSFTRGRHCHPPLLRRIQSTPSHHIPLLSQCVHRQRYFLSKWWILWAGTAQSA